MSDSDSDTTSGGGAENEGACGKLLEEIAEQEQVVEVDPISVMLDKMLSFADLDKGLVSEEDRETLYKRLEEIGLQQETVIVLFESKNNRLVEVPLDTDSDEPKSMLVKPAGNAIKLIPLANANFNENFLSRGFTPLVVKSHPLNSSGQLTMVTEFSKWLAAQGTTDFTLTNPMQSGIMDSAISVLEHQSSAKIVREILPIWVEEIIAEFDSRPTTSRTSSLAILDEIQFWRAEAAKLLRLKTEVSSDKVGSAIKQFNPKEVKEVGSVKSFIIEITQKYQEAVSNQNFLGSLEGPVKEIHTIAMENLNVLFKNIFSYVFIIRKNSQYYSSPMLIVRLLQKIGKEIMKRCEKHINVDRVFSGFIISTKKNIDQSIKCCEEWKESYNEITSSLRDHSNVTQLPDGAGIFTQIDAFMQRCRDLQDIADCQAQFARWLDGEKAPVPNIGDGESPLSTGLENIEKIYDKCLQSLFEVKITILDPSDSSWNDNYQKFRLGVNETENLVEKVLNEAFETVTSVKEGVEILDVFHQYTPRQRIRQVYEGKIERVYRKFNAQLQQVRRDLSMNKPVGLFDQPMFAAKNIWLNNLQTKINSTVDTLKSASWFATYGIMSVSKSEFKGVMQIISTQIEKTNKQWRAASDKGASQKLDNNLLMQNLHYQGMIDINFDRNLIKLIKEVKVWETYKFSIPSHIKSAYLKIGPTYTLLRRVYKLVQSYNQIMSSLSAAEKGLFKEKVRKIDRLLWLGQQNHTWNSPELDEWIMNCVDMVNTTFSNMEEYKENNKKIEELCRNIQTYEMIKIQANQITDGESFKSSQLANIEKVRIVIKKKYDDVKNVLESLQEHFSKQGTAIDKQWIKFSEKIDERVAQSLKEGILNSLMDLSETISTSGKTGLNPLMKISVQLKGSEVLITPKLSTILDIFKTIEFHLVELAKNINPGSRQWVDLISVTITENNDYIEIIDNIANEINFTINEVDAYIRTWDMYKDTWELDPKILLSKYMDGNPSTATFDSDVAKYKHMGKVCNKLEAQVWIGFMLIDCQLLQDGIVDLCDKWQDRFIDLMRTLVSRKLENIYGFIDESSHHLKLVPENVHELKEALSKHVKTCKEMPDVEKTFPTVYKLSEVLEKYSRELSEDESKKLVNLDKNWQQFSDFVHNAGLSLQSNKEKSKEELLSKSTDFERHIKNILEEYTISGPFGPSWKTEEAFSQLDGLKEKVAELNKNDSDISEGLVIFNIDRALCAELSSLTDKLEMLTMIWHLSEEWEQVHLKWQKTKIVEADLVEMKENMTVMESRLEMFQESDMDSRWEVFFQIKTQIQSYERTSSLISLLSDRALRPRHWDSILEYVRDAQPSFTKTYIDVNEITVEDLGIIGFDKCIGGIDSVVQSSHKEIEIEEELQVLAGSIQNSVLETNVNQDGFFIISNANDLFEIFENSQHKLWDLKLSKFIPPFITRVEELEKDITLILSLIETFVEAEKILLQIKDVVAAYCMKRQVPTEYRVLCDMIEFWSEVIAQIQSDSKIYSLKEQQQLTNGIKDMISGLNGIKTSLIPFFKCRKLECPRLNFFSNEDLFKLLAVKTSDELLPYLQHIYPNIAKIEGGTKRDGSINILKIITFDGESIAYPQTKQKEPIEIIITHVGELLNVHVRDQIVDCLQNLRKSQKYEKIQKDFSWQSYDVARKIQTTSEVTKILETSKGEEQNKQLCSLIKKIEEIMSKIQTSIGTSSTSRRSKLKMYNNLNTEFWLKIGLVCMQRYQVDHKIENCSSLASWVGYFKYSYNKARNEILVSQAYQSQVYGCESLRLAEPVVWQSHFPSTALQLSSTAATNRFPLLTGTAGDGKHSFIKSLSILLGRFLYKIQFLEDFLSPALINEFYKVLTKGPFFIQLNVSSINKQYLNMLSNRAETVKASNPAFRKVCSSFVVSTNLVYPELPHLTGILRKTFRQVSILPTVDDCSIDVKLIMECFSNFELMRAQMRILMRMFDDMYMGDGNKISRSQAIEVINSAVLLLKEDKSMLQEEAILQSFWRLFDRMSKYELDFPVFRATKDLFPRLELKILNKGPGPGFLESLTEFCKQRNYSNSEKLTSLIVSVWEKLQSSKALILCGAYNTQKTMIREFLVYHMKNISEQVVVNMTIPSNTNVVSFMFGEYDAGVWREGVLSRLLSEGGKRIFILSIDGAFDRSLWAFVTKLINTDFPVILPSGSRVALPPGSKIIIETSDYSDIKPDQLKDFAIQNIKENNLEEFDTLRNLFLTHYDEHIYERIQKFAKKYLHNFQEFLTNHCDPLIHQDFCITELNFYNLFSSLIKRFFPESQEWKSNDSLWQKMSLFCSVWAVFPSVNSEDQVKVDDHLRAGGTDVPVYGTVFDYFIDFESGAWEHWSTRIKDWVYDPKEASSGIFIESKEYVKFAYFIRLLSQQGQSVLLVGPKGCGKSSIVKHYLKTVNITNNHILSIQVCSNTMPEHVFDPLQKFMEKKTRDEMQPIGGKHLLLYLDDLDLNETSTLSEPLRFFKENKTWVKDREFKQFDKISMIGTECLNHASKPFSSSRSRKSFQYFYVDDMGEKEMREMYATIVKGKFWDFEVDIKFLTQSIVRGSINTYNTILNHFKQKQEKEHAASISNIFFKSDIKKVICGVLRSHKDCHDTKFEVVQLWVYEVFRTFRDRMTDTTAELEVVDIVRKETKKAFNMDFDSVCEDEENFEPPLFGNILDTYGFYTDLDDDDLTDYFPKKIEEYNSSGKYAEIDIIFNRKVIENTVRILRVISEPGGHIIITGKSGNCRQSMARLAAFVYDMKISVLDSNDLGCVDIWRSVLRNVVRHAGIENKQYLLYVIPGSGNSDTFLRVLTTLLAHGMDPLLLEGKELKILEKKTVKKTAEDGFNMISKNILKNLHLVFSMDLENPEVQSLTRKFSFLMSKFVMNHIQPYSTSDYEEIGSIYLEENMEKIEFDKKEDLPEVLSRIYLQAKDKILKITGVDILKTSAFCCFLKEFNFLTKKHFKVRKNLQDSYNKIFENNDEVEKIIANLYERSSEIKARLAGNQKVHDDMLMKKMQIKRDLEDVQKKLSDEDKKATDEKVQINQIETSLQSELEILWDPVEKSKQYLKELSSDDVDELFSVLESGSFRSAFLDAAKHLYVPPEETFTEKCFGFVINSMLTVAPDSLTDQQIFPFIDFLAKNKPRADIIHKVEELYVAESVKLWCIAMEAFGKAKKSGNQKRQKGEQLKKRYMTRLEAIKDIKVQVDKLDLAMESIEESISQICGEMESDTKNIEDIESKIEKAEKIRRILSCDQESFRLAHSTFSEDNLKIIGNSILSAGFLVFFAPFTSSMRKEIKQEWEDILMEAEIKFDPSLNHIDFVEGENTLSKLYSLQFPQTQMIYENFLILSRRSDLVVCIDPDDQSIPVISLSGMESGTIVTHMNDTYLRKNLIQSIGRGESITIRNADQGHEALLSPFLRKFIVKENETVYLRVFGSLCNYNQDFSMCILLSDFKFLNVTSKLKIVNFKFEKSDLDTMFLHVIAAKKLGNSYSQRHEALASINNINDDLEKEKTKIMDCLSLQVQQLLSETTLFDDVNSTREKIDTMEESKKASLITLESIDSNIETFNKLSTFCSSIIIAMSRMKQLNILYDVALETFLKLLDFKEDDEEQVDDSESVASTVKSYGTLKLSPDEHSVVQNLLKKIDLTVMKNDLPICATLLLVTIAKSKNNLEEKNVQDFISQLEKVSGDNSLSDVERLKPCLTEAEAKVVTTLVETESGREEGLPSILSRHQELNILKLISVLTVKDQRNLKQSSLELARICLDISWTVKDGLLFHNIMGLITAYIPTIFVYDGTSSPYKAIQELGSYQGIPGDQVIHVDHTDCSNSYKGIIEEAMEDGMWVVVSNCDQDQNFWTLLNFKLYQLKLEARVNANYRLFVVIRQASAAIIPNFVLQHSLLVCLEPPASPSDHVEILVTAAPGKADISVLTASHHAFIKKAQDLALLTDEDYMDALELSSCPSSNNQVLQQNVTELYSHQPRQASLKQAIENIGKHFYEKYKTMTNRSEFFELMNSEYGVIESSNDDYYDYLRNLRFIISNEEAKKDYQHQSPSTFLLSGFSFRKEVQNLIVSLESHSSTFKNNKRLATHFFLIKEFSELKGKMLKAQLDVRSALERKEDLADCLDHLVDIKAQLEEADEVYVTVKLHLLNDPARFLISRLLDPHCLGYKWPFGGLVFTFTVVNEINEDHVNHDNIFLDNAFLIGAGWDKERLCLTGDLKNRKLGLIRGVPTDKKVFSQPDNSIVIPVYSSKHSGELLQVPVGIGDQPRDFWERRNIYVRIE